MNPVPGSTSINRLTDRVPLVRDQPDIITAPMSSQRLAEGLTITKPGRRDAAVAGVIVECRCLEAWKAAVLHPLNSRRCEF
jgi:hypothetical protein